MPDIVHAQFTHTNAYLTQLIEQFTRIDQQIENGDTITINMSDGDRSMSLTVSRDKVVERATPPQRPAMGKAPALADNDSLVAALTKSCAPGMARYLVGASPTARLSQSRRQGEGQGRRREAGSEGSPIRNCGAMNKNRIGGVMHPGRAGT